MNIAYELLHKRIVEFEDNEKICNTKLLGFFSTRGKCQEAIKYYITQPGFKNYKDDFIVNIVTADVDDYNNEIGEFQGKVYYLSHEWYDGEYDYVTDIGYYSSWQNAEKARLLFQSDEEFIENPEGFTIDEYVIDEKEWREGFFAVGGQEDGLREP